MIRKVYKKNIWKAFLLVMLVTSCVMVVSCNKTGSLGKKSDTVVTHQFPNTNWAFEERVLDFGFDNLDSTASYEISFVLNYDKKNVTMDEVPIAVTLQSPDGMETFVTNTLRLKEDNPEFMKEVNGMTELSFVAFPKKNLNHKGKYHIKIYRKASNADNYGFNSLTLHISKVKNTQ
ncbi:MAG: hypothetical protein K6A41_06895 [Bacteroidales bacterium]|nr:hypothetical protein [Bacteroidales bacterium]